MRVAVDHEHAPAALGEGAREVDGGGLADPTPLVAHGDDDGLGVPAGAGRVVTGDSGAGRRVRTSPFPGPAALIVETRSDQDHSCPIVQKRSWSRLGRTRPPVGAEILHMPLALQSGRRGTPETPKGPPLRQVPRGGPFARRVCAVSGDQAASAGAGTDRDVAGQMVPQVRQSWPSRPGAPMRSISARM